MLPFVPPLSFVTISPISCVCCRVRRRLRGKQAFEMKSARSFSESWAWYVRGHVVSRQAQRHIVQFLAACCGKSKTRDDYIPKEEDDCAKDRILPPNAITLERVHHILDAMAGEASEEATTSKQRKDLPDGEDEEVDAKALKQSSTIQSAMRVTADLWPRNSVQWRNDVVDARSTSLISQSKARTRRRRRKRWTRMLEKQPQKPG